MIKLKIGVLTSFIENNSGSRAPLEIAKGLAKLGNQVTLYAYNKPVQKEALNSLIEAGVGVKVVSKSQVPLLARFFPNIELVKFLRKDKPNLALLASSLPFLFSAKIAGIRVIRIYMGTQFGAYLERKLPNEKINILDIFLNTLGDIAIYLLNLIASHLSNHIIAISKYAAYENEKLYKKKVARIIYLGGDHFGNPKTSKNRMNNVCHLLSISRFTPYKGFHVLIDSLAKLKNNKKIVLNIVGSMNKLRYLKYLKKIAKKNVKIIVNPDDKQLEKLYRECNIYITCDRYLFFGLPVVEAAFFKKPAIAFDFAAASEVVDSGKTGFVVKNQKEMASSVKLLINNPDFSKKMGQEALYRAKRLFTWGKITKDYDQFLRQIFK